MNLAPGGDHSAQTLLSRADWSNTAVGPRESWPPALKTMVAFAMASPLAVAIVWGESLTTIYNEAYAALLGDKHPAAFGQPFSTIWSDYWHNAGPLVDLAFRGEATLFEDIPFKLTRDGKPAEAWVSYACSPIFVDDDGRVGGMIATCQDSTAKVQLEQMKEREARRLHSMYEQSPGLVAILEGPNHVMRFMNRAYREFVGEQDLLGRNIKEALPEIAAQGFGDLIDRVYQTGEPFVGTELPAVVRRWPDGAMHERYFDFVYQPITDDEGKVSGIFTEGIDVTERVQRDRIMRDSERKKDEFLAMLAHELRNPIAPISSAASLLKMGKMEPPRINELGDIIERQVSHVTQLLDDLLDVSRVTRGLVSIKQEAVDLKSVLATAVEQARPLIERRQHTLRTRIGAAPADTRGDVVRLVQVVVNLLNNACKFTPPGGKIAAELEVTEAAAIIRVSDNGEGIDAALLPQVFELFTQGKRSPDRSQGGLGIGLSLVKSLVELHGGQVTASSDGAGKGSSFTVQLPLVAVTDSPGEARPAGYSPPPRPLNIALVDDNVDAAEVLGQLLRALGHQVSAHHDARSLLDSQGIGDVDVFLLDIGLPGMDGYSLARALRARDDTEGAAFIALTGYGQDNDVADAGAAGFSHHLVKPVRLETLKERLDQI
jgi:signal transduction histidine kinase